MRCGHFASHYLRRSKLVLDGLFFYEVWSDGLVWLDEVGDQTRLTATSDV